VRGAPLALLALALVATAGCGGADDRRAPAREARTTTGTRAAPAVEPGARALEHLDALLEHTREAGGDRVASTDGERATAAYATAVLREAGLRVRRQPVRFAFFEERGPARVTADGRGVGAPGQVRTLAYSASGSATGPVAVVAFDRADSGCRRTDFTAVRRGDVVLAGRGVCPFARKVRLAQRAGADAVVVADRRDSDAPRGTLGRPGIATVPAVAVGRDAGERLRRARRASVRVRAVSEQRTSSNVVADTPAAERRRRAVMVGAHLDSVARAPGANDNASGVAAALAAAEALARDGTAVRVGLWGAEELGLHGSRAYVRRIDDARRRQIRAYVNLDMVGSRNGEAAVYGDRAPRAALREALDTRGPAPGRTRMRGGSDHVPFARAGIPVGGIFTGASRRSDPCYHRACDTGANVDRRLLARVARATATALRALAS